MPMKNPPHPSLSVRHDCLEPLGLSVTEAAKKLGISRRREWVSFPKRGEKKWRNEPER